MSTKEIFSYQFKECQFTLDPNRCKTLTSSEKLTTAIYLCTLRQEANDALGILRTHVVSTVPDRTIEDIKENAQRNSLLKKVADCIIKTPVSNPDDPNARVQLGQSLYGIVNNLMQFRSTLETAYDTLALSELPNWGSSFQGKPSSVAPELIFQAQQEVLAILKQYSLIKHVENKIDFVTENLDLATLPLITTGMDSHSRPFIFIKADVKEANRQNQQKVIHFRGEYQDSFDNVRKTPHWRVLSGGEYFGNYMSHEKFVIKLQQFFTEGFVWQHNGLKFRLTFPKPS